MKFFMMILAAMALAECSFGYTPPSKVSDDVYDMLADSRDSDNGDGGDEVKFNPPLPETDTKPILVDTDVALADDNDGDADHPLSETDTGETILPVDTVDVDASETIDAPNVDADGNSDSDIENISEPKVDSSDTQETQDAEAEISLPCVPNCANKQCGDNGCDGLCSACPEGLTCTADFVCECTVDCQIPAEPTADATDATDATDADTGTTTTVDTEVDVPSSVDSADATVDAPSGEINPSVDMVVSVESTVDTNAAEVSAEIANDDTVTMVEVAQNADTATEAEVGTETGEDTVGEPDIFVQPCVADITLCDDGNICTDDWCDTAIGCAHSNNTALCDDSNQCTVNDACANSVCAPGTPVVCDDSDDCTDDYCTNGVGCVYEWVCECASDAQCDDLNPCTDDSCTSGFCEYAFNSIACDNGDACTITDQCVGGECLGIAPLNCDDENQCTIDTCNPTIGCQHESQTGMACNDGNACTTVDTCEKDVCIGAAAIICNDQNPCTDDSCDEQSGCVYTSNNANPCEDGSLCTVNDYCDVGKCQGGQALECDDSNLCTDNVCQPQKGCVYPANQVGCDDGNACTVGDICAEKSCASGTNICECGSDADCASADDDNLCNGTVVCDQSTIPFKCVTDLETIVICDANQDTACLKNTCVPDTGDCQMKAVNEGGGCDDGNACTTGDQCADGICAGQSIKCDDSNVCTDDSCASASGCVFTPNKADCDDGSVCTMLDVCQGGQCVGTAPLDCDDSKECTLDICHKALGCQHSKTALNGQACDNGDACTVDDTCQNGACQAGTPTCECYVTADCADKEDGDFCNGTLVCDTSQMPHLCVLDTDTIITCPVTSDTTCSKNTCQLTSGKCEMKAVNEGGECDDGNPCTDADACKSGDCVGAPKPSGTVLWQDDFNDGNLDGWTTKSWNECWCGDACCPETCLIEVIEQEPYWVSFKPLGSLTFGEMSTPPMDLPENGVINLNFAGTSLGCDCPLGWCKVLSEIDKTETLLGSVTSTSASTPPTEPKSVTIQAGGNGSILIRCQGGSMGACNACSGAALDNFSISCP